MARANLGSPYRPANLSSNSLDDLARSVEDELLRISQALEQEVKRTDTLIVLDFGTMAFQNADSVNITGGKLAGVSFKDSITPASTFTIDLGYEVVFGADFTNNGTLVNNGQFHIR